jgi:hypothetical protein
MKKHVCATAAVVMLATSSVQGATIFNDNPPFTLSATIWFFQPLGQSFTAIDSNLLSIGFLFDVANPGFGGVPIQLDLRAGSGLGGTLIATRSFTLPDDFHGGFVDIDFSGTNLTIGHMYTATLSLSSTSIAPRHGVGFYNDTYAGGQVYSATWSDFVPDIYNLSDPANADLSFRVIGNSTPLPAAFPLFATGLGALGLIGWRRKRTRAT